MRHRDIPPDAIVWRDDDEGMIWVDPRGDGDKGVVCFVLDAENYEAWLTVDETRAFAKALLEAANRLRPRS